MAQRRVARDGLRLLAGLARADGILHSDEIVVILDYIAAVADREGIATTEDDRAALFGYVKRQRPTSEILEDCLDRMEYAGAEDQRLFIERARPEERRGGKECGRTCSSRWSPDHLQKKIEKLSKIIS